MHDDVGWMVLPSSEAIEEAAIDSFDRAWAFSGCVRSDSCRHRNRRLLHVQGSVSLADMPLEMVW